MTESTLDERFTGVLAPDAILPSQYYGSRGRTDMTGERRLMVAILEDALRCFQKHVADLDPKGRQLYLDAEEWIMGDNPTWFFSFPSVCATLDLDPEYVRQGLARWRDARSVVEPSGDGGGEASSDDHEPLRRASA
jgi:hypothetical protein